jgi:hypothetical protein
MEENLSRYRKFAPSKIKAELDVCSVQIKVSAQTLRLEEFLKAKNTRQ